MSDSHNDKVNHPAHYGGASNTYEAIKVIEALGFGFHLGNAFKYIARAGKKDSNKTIEDLEKAEWYLKRMIEKLKTDAAIVTESGVYAKTSNNKRVCNPKKRITKRKRKN